MIDRHNQEMLKLISQKKNLKTGHFFPREQGKMICG